MRAWVTRNKRGMAYLHEQYPYKIEEFGIWRSAGHIHIQDRNFLPKDINPQWSDIEPIKVELKIERV